MNDVSESAFYICVFLCLNKIFLPLLCVVLIGFDVFATVFRKMNLFTHASTAAVFSSMKHAAHS